MNRAFVLSLSLITVVLGVTLGGYLHTISAKDTVQPMDREQQLALEKKNLLEDVYALQKEVTALSTELEQAGLGQSEADEVLERELANIKQAAGLSPVIGAGVELVVQNLPEQGGLNAVDVPGVSDEQLLKLVNELFSAGSEVIAINNQRFTATSEIRLAGNHININQTPQVAPYRITAVGDAAVLKSRLELNDGLVGYIRESGISVEIQEKDELTIPAYAGEIYFEYAKPVKED